MDSKRSDSIFREFSAAIRGFITKHTSTSNDVEDILQDIFYKFIVADGDQQLVENVSAWLHRATRNLIIDRSRKIKEERIAPNREFSILDNSYESDPEQSIISAMIREEVEAALSKLPHEQRAIFELNHIQGISFREISQSTGISINTLISRKRYAVEQLREELAQLYDDLFD